jgi:hypothetical protein
MSNFTNVLMALVSTFLFVAYIVVMFQVVVDLFRRSDIGGWNKAAWVIGLLFIPIVTALIYVIAHGRGMAERQRTAAQRAVSDSEAYVRRIAGTSSSEEIAKAKSLLDAGTITPAEYDTLKDRALHAPM